MYAILRSFGRRPDVQVGLGVGYERLEQARGH